jgi:hypothetical protein
MEIIEAKKVDLLRIRSDGKGCEKWVVNPSLKQPISLHVNHLSAAHKRARAHQKKNQFRTKLDLH